MSENHRKSTLSFIGTIIIFILVFTQCYAQRLKGLHVSTRIIVGLIGVFFILKDIITSIFITRQGIQINKKIIPIFFWYFFLILIFMITWFLNGESDNFMLLYPVSPIIMLCSAYATIRIAIFIDPDWRLEKILYFFIVAVFVQDVLSLLMYKYIVVHDFLYSFVELDKLEEIVLTNTKGTRLLGWGANFVNLGIANSYAMLFIMFLLKNKNQFKSANQSTMRQVVLIIMFLYIFVIGNMQARTTTIGGIIAIFYYVFSSFNFNFNKFIYLIRFLVGLFVVGFSIYALINVFNPQLIKQNQGLIDYGFEAFNNYANNGDVSTGSTDELARMYDIKPDNFKTWFIGDARMYGQLHDSASGYYKGTDIGYYRLIFCMGIIGLITYLGYQCYLGFNSFMGRSKIPLAGFYCCAIVLIVFVKTYMDSTNYVAMFWVFNKFNFYSKDGFIYKSVEL